MKLTIETNQPAYIYSPFKLKVENEVGNTAIIGRNSYSILRLVDFFRNLEQKNELLLEVGSFVEAAGNTRVVVGGEHHNSYVFNNALAYLPFVLKELDQEKEPLVYPFSKGKLTIGSNVVISTAVTILSGVTIGSGALIGAGAVVTRDVPPFAVVAGNPAKVMKFRFSEEVINTLLKIRWWDFEYDFMSKNINQLVGANAEEIIERFGNLEANVYAAEDEYLQFRKKGDYRIIDSNTHTGLKFDGVEVSGKMFSLNELPSSVKNYFEQTHGNDLTIDANILDLLKQ